MGEAGSSARIPMAEGSRMNPLVLIILILLLFGGLPTWNLHSYGYYPSGAAGTVLLILIILILLGRL
jgi:hypothetical protein